MTQTRKFHLFFLLLFLAGTPQYVAADLLPGGMVGDDRVSIIYVAGSGELGVEMGDLTLSSLFIGSESGVFTGMGPSQNLDGMFDVDPLGDPPNPNELFKVEPVGFQDLSFGHVAAKGLSEATVLADLSVEGSFLPSGLLGVADLIYIPEPEGFSMAILCLGLLPLMRRLK